jgi:hypothetical protein
MYGGVIILSTAYYAVWGRKTFTPPNETLEDFMEPSVSALEVEEGVKMGKVDAN